MLGAAVLSGLQCTEETQSSALLHEGYCRTVNGLHAVEC